jgi:hypothetical protein
VPTAPPPLARRLAAGVALVALPLVAAVGCGEAVEAKKESVQGSLQKASDNLSASESVSVVMRFDDASGNARKALTTASEDPATPAQADLLLGGRISFTVDPAAGKTLRDLQTADPALPVAEQLKLVNLAMEVQADGGPLAQIRLVGGDLYANVGLDKITDVAEKAGSTEDLAGQVQQFAASAPAQFQPLVADVMAGKWVKVPLAPYAEQLKQLGEEGAPVPSPSVDTQKLGTDLLNAVKPFVAVSDATSDGDERVLDVKVQAKQAVQAAMTAFTQAAPGVPGLDQLDTSGVDRIGDGTVDGQVTLSGDHLEKITMDLGSAERLAPPGATPSPDLSGSLLTVDVDDAADEVAVPDDVSSFDVGAVVQQLLDTLSASRPS